MSTERHVEPALLQALEDVQDALCAERRAEDPTSRENARLRARLEQLQAERGALRRTLDTPGREEQPDAPRLPEVLAPPFEVRAHDTRRQRLRSLGLAPLAVVLVLLVEGDLRARALNLLLLLVVVAVQGVRFLRGGARWRFERTRFHGGWVKRLGESTGLWDAVRYPEVVDVEVHASASQRRRGVGTLRVTYLRWVSGTEQRPALWLRNVPEPERLAAWLRTMRSGAD